MTPGRAGAQAAPASYPLSWCMGTEREAAKSGGAGTAADCDHTGARRRLRAHADRPARVAHEPAAIQRILTHLGLAARPPPRAPARRVDLLQAA